MRVPQKVKHKVSTLRINLREMKTYVQTKTGCMQRFVAVLFLIAKK